MKDTYKIKTYTHLLHIHTFAAHTYICCTYIHLLHIHTFAAHTYICCTYTHLLHIHTFAAHTYICCTYTHLLHIHGRSTARTQTFPHHKLNKPKYIFGAMEIKFEIK